MPNDQFLTIAALTKWAQGEALSTNDFMRVISLFQRFPPQLEVTTQENYQAGMAQFREVLRQYVAAQQQQQQ